MFAIVFHMSPCAQCPHFSFGWRPLFAPLVFRPYSTDYLGVATGYTGTTYLDEVVRKSDLTNNTQSHIRLRRI